MPMLMAQVVLDKKTQRDRIVFADGADGFEPFFGDAIHHGRKNLVLHLPPMQQSRPVLIGIAMCGYPSVLRVVWPGKKSVDGGAHKSLAVVGR